MEFRSHRLGSHVAALLALGLPLATSNIFAFLIRVADNVMMGWYGIEELAGTVLGGNLWFILFILGSGFGSALPGVVAAAVSRGDPTQVRRAARMTIWLTLIYGVIAAPVCLLTEPLLLWLGQKPEVAALAGDYLRITGFGVIPGLLSNVLRYYVSALGRTAVIIAVMACAVVLHVLLNWALIFGHFGFPELGIRGAAISTLMTDTAILLALAAYALWRFPEYDLLRRFWRPDREALVRVFHLGWPIGLQMLAEVGLFSGVALLMGRISTAALAAHGLALQMAAFTFLLHLGVANAATIRAGQALGQGDFAGLRLGALAAVVTSCAIALVTSAVFVAFASDLLSLYLDPANPETPAVIAVGTTLVYLAALFQLADGGQATVIGLLRGVQDTRVPMYLAIGSYWGIGLPVALLLGFTYGLGAAGVWLGLVVGLVVIWIGLLLRFWIWAAADTALHKLVSGPRGLSPGPDF